MADLRPLDFDRRLDRLRLALVANELDGLLVTNLTNVRYLTGFTGSAGIVAVTEADVVLTTDGRYRTQAGEQVDAAGIGGRVAIEIGGAEEQRTALLERLAGAARVGLEAEDVTWAQAVAWQERLGRDAVRSAGIVEALREVKDGGEIDRMRRAASIADDALAEVLPMLAAAATSTLEEQEFALALDSAMRRRGAESVAFETIVASGENSAKPHHHPSARRIEKGDPVVVDFGATFEGYRSDMTRTFVVGGLPTGKLKEIFDLVATSQSAGVAAVQPGVITGSVDAVCRDIIAAAGMAERFEHSTGHGVGLDIHEAPWVAAKATAILEPGAVVTVEPGVYVAGVGGVRIEDTLVVTDDGAEPLTRFTKEVVA